MSNHKPNNSQHESLFTTVEDVAWFFYQRCFYCGKAPTLRSLSGLDRVSCVFPYSKGTVVSCCTRCNYAKGQSDPRLFCRQIAAVVHYRRWRFYNGDDDRRSHPNVKVGPDLRLPKRATDAVLFPGLVGSLPLLVPIPRRWFQRDGGQISDADLVASIPGCDGLTKFDLPDHMTYKNTYGGYFHLKWAHRFNEDSTSASSVDAGKFNP
eukprot:GHVU01079335.1.p2 GENE.GHVU01079335.1~~GHVU01079335.1.p2  ORF type:complete len:208 (-),score=13.19 GHVU01079335.1:973-1596(-)